MKNPRTFARIASMIAIFTAASVAPVPAVPPSREISIKQLIPLASSQRDFKIIDGKDRGRMPASSGGWGA